MVNVLHTTLLLKRNMRSSRSKYAHPKSSDLVWKMVFLTNIALIPFLGSNTKAMQTHDYDKQKNLRI